MKSSISVLFTSCVLLSQIAAAASTVEEPNPRRILFEQAIRTLGGAIVDPAAYPEDLHGFQQFLQASGVTVFSAQEMTRPYHLDVALRHGFNCFLPSREWWPRGAALALMAQHISNAIGEKIMLRNWWRPPAYNRDPVVGGAKEGDHLAAFGMDLDFASARSRRRAEHWLRELGHTRPWMQVSLGLGERTAHVGLLSDRGHREWHYAGYTP